MTTSAPVLLTLKQTCELLQLKPSRLYYLTSTKQIPFIKIGSTLRPCVQLDTSHIDATT
jgi:predicted DNA-binding transcriptional regulator AlpA